MLSSNCKSQSFNGYQTIGTNTFSFSLIWKGKPHVGFSYTIRKFGSSFVDIQSELRFPIENGIQGDEFEFISGVYRPSRLKRFFVGTGLHLSWDHNVNSSYHDKLSCSITAIPSYVYSASINDGLYGTSGIRISYNPTLWSKIVEEKVAKHKLHVGIHLDSHHERTLGLSLNPKYTFHLDSEETNSLSGDFYFGQTYFLRRF
jgi:hypothetical protein